MTTENFNPMGLAGFEFVEFASPTPSLLEQLFEKMGFTLVAKYRSKDVLLYRQGDINFVGPKSLAEIIRTLSPLATSTTMQAAAPFSCPNSGMRKLIRLPRKYMRSCTQDAQWSRSISTLSLPAAGASIAPRNRKSSKTG